MAGSMTGCGAGSDQSADAEESHVQENADQTADAADDGEVHLRVWSGEEDKDLIATIADNFIAEHASEADITIEWEPVMEGDCRTSLLGDVCNAADVYTTTDGDIRIIVAGGAASEVRNPDGICILSSDRLG